MSFLHPAVTEGQETSEQQSFTQVILKSEKNNHSKKTTIKHGVEDSELFPPRNRTPRTTLEKSFESRKTVFNTARPTSLNLPPAVVSEDRKNSTDSSNTDRLMRLTPTGIKFGKPESTRSRTAQNLPREGVKINSGEKSGMSSHIDAVRGETAVKMDQNEESISDLFTRNVKSTERGKSHLKHFSSILETPNAGTIPNKTHRTRNLQTGNVKIPIRWTSHQMSYPVRGTPNDKVSPNIDKSPRLGASEELQRVVEKVKSKDAHRNNRYLDGKVSKTELMRKDRMELLNNVRLIAFKGNHGKRTESNNSDTMKEPLNLSYPTRINIRDISLPRLRREQTPYRNPTVDEHKRTSYERDSFRVRNASNSDPAKLDSGYINVDHKLRSRTKSAPDLKTGLMDTSSLGRKQEFRSSLRTWKTSFDRTPGASYGNDDLDSAETDALVINPPMPLFDASPSLTTESEEHSLISQDSENTLIENLALKSSFLASEHKSPAENSYFKHNTSPQEVDFQQEWPEENPESQR